MDAKRGQNFDDRRGISISISIHMCFIKDTISYIYLYFKYLPIYTKNHEFILTAPASSF